MLRATSLALILSLLFAPTLAAREDPINTTFVGHWEIPGDSYADVWGEGDLAFVAHNGEEFVDIVDVSDPAAPVLVATYDAGGGGFFGPSAQDVKTAHGLMFVGLESSSPGVHIVDIRNPATPTLLTEITARSNIHNLFYSDGWLYLADSFQPEIDLIDLRDYDPDNAPATIGSATATIPNVGSFVHDITVENGRLYAAAWNRLEVWDVSALPAQPQRLATANGNSVHSSWPTADGQYVVVGEERGGGGISLFQVTEVGGQVQLSKLDELVAPSNLAFSAHNPVVAGDLVYVSWYGLGVVVVEIDRAAGRLRLRGLFDTTEVAGGGFSGCWGVYPFLGADRILASDMGNGLIVFSFDG